MRQAKMLDEEKALAVARLLKKGEIASIISQKIGVSGRDIGKVNRMIQEGLIVFDEDEPRFTIPYDKLERAVSSNPKHNIEEISRETVVETYRTQVAKAAKDQTDAMFILANALWQAVVPWFIRRGYTLEDLRTQPIHQIVLEYLDKGEKYDQLLPEYQRLQQELEILRPRVDPIIRLEHAMTKLIPKTILHLAALDELGANIEPLAQHYTKFINQYLKGAPDA